MNPLLARLNAASAGDARAMLEGVYEHSPWIAEAAIALIDDFYHTIEGGEEVDRLKFKSRLEAQLDALRNLDFEVSLAVAPEQISLYKVIRFLLDEFS